MGICRSPIAPSKQWRPSSHSAASSQALRSRLTSGDMHFTTCPSTSSPLTRPHRGGLPPGLQGSGAAWGWPPTGPPFCTGGGLDGKREERPFGGCQGAVSLPLNNICATPLPRLFLGSPVRTMKEPEPLAAPAALLGQAWCLSARPLTAAQTALKTPVHLCPHRPRPRLRAAQPHSTGSGGNAGLQLPLPWPSHCLRVRVCRVETVTEPDLVLL